MYSFSNHKRLKATLRLIQSSDVDTRLQTLSEANSSESVRGNVIDELEQIVHRKGWRGMLVWVLLRECFTSHQRVHQNPGVCSCPPAGQAATIPQRRRRPCRRVPIRAAFPEQIASEIVDRPGRRWFGKNMPQH